MKYYLCSIKSNGLCIILASHFFYILLFMENVFFV